MAYIERDIFINNELIPLVKRLDLCHPKQKKGVLMAISKLKEAPAVDAVEVKHGENITKMHPTDEFICSECGLIMRDFEEIRVDEENDECYYEFEFKYCPRCGAKMDGKDGE